MTATQYLGGRLYEYDETDNSWHSPDTETCPRCGRTLHPGQEPDPCIGHVPGAETVCCGHGVEEPYVLFRGPAALRAIEWAKAERDRSPDAVAARVMARHQGALDKLAVHDRVEDSEWQPKTTTTGEGAQYELPTITAE